MRVAHEMSASDFRLSEEDQGRSEILAFNYQHREYELSLRLRRNCFSAHRPNIYFPGFLRFRVLKAVVRNCVVPKLLDNWDESLL